MRSVLPSLTPPYSIENTNLKTHTKMQTALEVLRKHTGLTVTDLDAVRMQTEIKFVEQAMQDYAKLYACEKVKEAFSTVADKAERSYTGLNSVDVLSLETEILTKINKEG